MGKTQHINMFKAVLALLAATAAAHGDDGFGERTCGTPEMDGPTRQRTQQVSTRMMDRLCHAAQLVNACNVDRPRWQAVCEMCREGPPEQIFTIKTAVHVIYNPNTDEGLLTDEEIQAQMDAVNAGYSGDMDVNGSAGRVPFFFEVDHVTFTGNARWFNDLQRHESEIRQELAYEPATHFQLYFGDFRSGLLGYCYFPSSFAADSWRHGCSNLYSSIPGGSAAPYNLGATVTHEIGHGVGLFHVFGSGCNDGDEVADPPFQSSSTSGCPASKDSCPNDLGKDAVDNFMDYSYDACMTKFSPGQAQRALEQILAFRPRLIMDETDMNEIKSLVPDAWVETDAHQRSEARTFE